MQSHHSLVWLVLFSLLSAVGSSFALPLLAAPPYKPRSSPGLVISQVYPGGGLLGATYKSDFVELFNRGDVPVNVNGWSVQFASGADDFGGGLTPLQGLILPGHYYLVQEQTGEFGTVDLPAPDALGKVNLSVNAAKVALVDNSHPLAGACPLADTVDFIGYGAGRKGANCYEGTGPAPDLGQNTTLAEMRRSNGCVDADNNSTDFITAAAAPRNSKSVASLCPVLPTETATDTATNTATATDTRTPTHTPSNTSTYTPTNTSTPSPTNGAMDTMTPTNTVTGHRTQTLTRTPTATCTRTETLTPSSTATNTRTATRSRTPTFTRTATAMPSGTVTGTPTGTLAPTGLMNPVNL